MRKIMINTSKSQKNRVGGMSGSAEESAAEKTFSYERVGGHGDTSGDILG